MLTERANRYLKTLQRLNTVPSPDEVEKVLRDQGSPCFAPWLDFQERYAGFVEPIGHDTAIWGIVHEKSKWIPAGKAEVDREIHDEIWYVACADVHPSYKYVLDNKGEFLGTPAESFEVKVERDALRWTFSKEHNSAKVHFNVKEPALLDALRRGAILASEASDHFFKYFLGEHAVTIEDVETGMVVEAWTGE